MLNRILSSCFKKRKLQQKRGSVCVNMYKRHMDNNKGEWKRKGGRRVWMWAGIGVKAENCT